MGKKGTKSGPKDPFDALPQDFKDAVAGMSTDEIRERITKVAIDQVELMAAKKLDGHLEEARATFQEAGRLYREGTKTNKLKIEFAKRVLDDKGGGARVQRAAAK